MQDNDSSNHNTGEGASTADNASNGNGASGIIAGSRSASNASGAGNDVGIERVGQIAINVHDLARATAFYRDVLGLRFQFEVPKMAFFDCGGVRLMLGIASEARFDHPASIIYYAVADIEAAADTLKSRGVSFESEPHAVADLGDRVLWLAFLEDTEGNVVGLMSEVMKAG